MSQLDAEKWISKWNAEYPIVGDVSFVGYQDLGTRTSGKTIYTLGYPQILLHTALRSHPVWALSVLWHEYAHCAAYYDNDRHGQQHNEKWRGWLWKKPILALINTFAPAPSLLD